MKHFSLIALVILTILARPLLAQNFSAVNPQGQTIYYYVIPDKVRECAVTEHPQNNYTGDLVIPDSVEYEGVRYAVTELGNGAFFACTQLYSITFPETLRYFGSGVFSRDYQQMSLCFPSIENLCRIESFEAPINFDGRLIIKGEEITDLVFPEGITAIKCSAFGHFRYIKSIKIPSTVKEIGINMGRDGVLERVEFPSIEHLLSIKFRSIGNNPLCSGHHLFIEGKEITEIELPDTLTSIPKYVFTGCTELRKVIVPNGVTSIEESAFSGCPKLEYLNFPDKLSSIGMGAFSCCSNLVIEEIPQSVKSIGDGAFAGCDKIKKIVALGVKSLGDAFRNCSNLEEAYLGNYFTYISHGLFYGSPIHYLNIKAVVPPDVSLNYDILDIDKTTNRYNATLEVPKGCRDKYLAKTPWNRFKEIIESDEDPEEEICCEKPSISYQKGKLVFSSDTPNAVFHYSIADADIVSDMASSDGIVPLHAAYNISVYASASGMRNSDVAKATLCWLDSEPEIRDVEDIAQIKATAVLIKIDGQGITIENVTDTESIQFYNSLGQLLGSAPVVMGKCHFQTVTDIVIVKIGAQSIKLKTR